MRRIAAVLIAIALLITPQAHAAAQSSLDNFTSLYAYSTGLFPDIDESKWYGLSDQRVVAIAYELGLMNGRSDGFAPDAYITAAEAVTMAARLHDIYSGGDGVFTQGAIWYQVYVEYALTHGIIASGDTFDRSEPITRADMAYLFANALPSYELEQINDITILPDVKTGDARADSIFTLYCAGVLCGNDIYGTFAPERNIVRAEAAAILIRMARPELRVSLPLLELNLPVWEDAYISGMTVSTQAEFEQLLQVAAYSLIRTVQVRVSRAIYDSFSNETLNLPDGVKSARAVYYVNLGNLTVTLDYFLAHELSMLGVNRPHALAGGSSEALDAVQAIWDFTNMLITSRMTELEKARTVYDYIIINFAYDTRVSADPDNSAYAASYTPMGLLENGIGVCQAYSELYYNVLSRAGMVCLTVRGTVGGQAHMWNLVRIGDAYYHADLTFDDPIPDKAGRVLHDYFLITDAQIGTDHVWSHADYPATQ